jgi:GeoRSP system SPASM domain protein
MKFRELSFPVTAYVDLGPNFSVSPLRLCEELVSNKVLTVHLSAAESPFSDCCLDILQGLKDQQIAIFLTIPLGAPNDTILRILQRCDLRGLFFEVFSSKEAEKAAEKIKTLREYLKAAETDEKNEVFGLSFSITKLNYGELPLALSICSSSGIMRFTVPIQRIKVGEELFYLGKGEREELLGITENISQQMRPIIHDPFLWRLFYPSAALPEGGCNAANTMLYISPDGCVYPCPSLPFKLGTLKNGNLREIMSSRQKSELRKMLSKLPVECHQCVKATHCLGGCRGRSFVVNNSFAAIDPACGG